MAAKRPWFIGLGLALAFAALLVLSGASYTVSETEQVIITQFGKPVGEPITEAGLHFKVPFVQKANRIDKRILEWDGQRTIVFAKRDPKGPIYRRELTSHRQCDFDLVTHRWFGGFQEDFFDTDIG